MEWAGRALGTRVVAHARLGGGIDADTYSLTLGSGETVVLRQPQDSDWDDLDRHARVLEAVTAAGVPAPRLLAVDGRGEAAGRPSLVMSMLSGTAALPPTADDRWLRSLAEAAAALHDVSGPGLAWLGDRVERMRTLVAADPPREVDGPAGAAWDALAADPTVLGESVACLVHVDFWSGNTLRDGSQVTGVIDWSQAALGRPEVDVAECAFDLTVSRGPEVGARFIQLYRAVTGRPLEAIDAWMAVSVVRSTDLDQWLPGWSDLGLKVEAELAFSRRERVLSAAMAALRG